MEKGCRNLHDVPGGTFQQDGEELVLTVYRGLVEDLVPKSLPCNCMGLWPTSSVSLGADMSPQWEGRSTGFPGLGCSPEVNTSKVRISCSLCRQVSSGQLVPQSGLRSPPSNIMGPAVLLQVAALSHTLGRKESFYT